mmetsp:Transcript_12500/g.24337  ORF Transcript_12500/g.24337 Transcript_12500/m.24337 type:complete len:105 (+) Transcript_12500:314-628(+)
MGALTTNATFAEPKVCSRVANRMERTESNVAKTNRSKAKHHQTGKNARGHAMQIGELMDKVVVFGSAAPQQVSVVLRNMTGMHNAGKLVPQKKARLTPETLGPA